MLCMRIVEYGKFGSVYVAAYIKNFGSGEALTPTTSRECYISSLSSFDIVRSLLLHRCFAVAPIAGYDTCRSQNVLTSFTHIRLRRYAKTVIRCAQADAQLPTMNRGSYRSSNRAAVTYVDFISMTVLAAHAARNANVRLSLSRSLPGSRNARCKDDLPRHNPERYTVSYR
ncbi:hypothetical protein AC578_3813 [Pseudocercospora eumusae]|uniref:Uncharacterized protein n=1 Tax=Pseudocercospora eumusae TaxID=321146 RepID=A0A139HFH3_9PEZI|nr:hypothetical protein AC578_3813 [Pseudocercospora eumusae]